jgi:transposase
MHTNQPGPNTDPTLFDLPATAAGDAAPVDSPRPRLREMNRAQLEWRPVDLEALLPDDHPARIVWEYVAGLDLTAVYAQIQAVEGHAGRPATEPRLLLALWLLATLDGVGSARALARLCEAHAAYQWLCGGVSVNYHTLAEFRTAHVELLDALLTHSVATLMAEGLVTLAQVTQDGMRVRASAGAASFRREPTLARCLADAEAQVQALRAEVDADPAAGSRREQAARQRAVRERRARVARALAQLPTIAAKTSKGAPPKPPRASTTDPEARVMKMADGGFRPAYNIQFAGDSPAQVVVGVAIETRGSDAGQLAPMVTQLTARYGRAPTTMLVDGSYATHDDLVALSPHTLIYAPLPTPRPPTRDPALPRPGDPPAIAAWRQRMGTPEARAIYKARGATAECLNAQARNHGLWRLLVRGVEKVRAIALWHALAHNLRRAVALRAAALAVT